MINESKLTDHNDDHHGFLSENNGIVNITKWQRNKENDNNSNKFKIRKKIKDIHKNNENLGNIYNHYNAN